MARRSARVCSSRCPYDLVRDFTAVSTLAYFDIVLVTNATSGLGTVADVLAYAKKNPGKLSIGTGNIGTTQYLAVQLLTSMANISAQTIPFKATPVAINALRGNEIPLIVETVPALIGQLKSGALKALGVGSTQRTPLLPDTPTLAESGVSGYEATSWTGISVKAKTPEAIITRPAPGNQRRGEIRRSHAKARRHGCEWPCQRITRSSAQAHAHGNRQVEGGHRARGH